MYNYVMCDAILTATEMHLIDETKSERLKN